jgi:antitoxin (DNA-binding transcriptional repressor) of toxin-antitoxin stability system
MNQRTSAVLADVLDTGEPVAITYHGQPKLVIVRAGEQLSAIDRLVLAGRALPGRSATSGPAAPVPPVPFTTPVDELLAQVRDDR